MVFQDLSAALKGALSGSLESLMLGLMKSTAQYDASELKASMKVRVLNLSSSCSATCWSEHKRSALITCRELDRLRSTTGHQRRSDPVLFAGFNVGSVMWLCRDSEPTRRP